MGPAIDAVARITAQDGNERPTAKERAIHPVRVCPARHQARSTRKVARTRIRNKNASRRQQIHPVQRAGLLPTLEEQKPRKSAVHCTHHGVHAEIRSRKVPRAP